MIDETVGASVAFVDGCSLSREHSWRPFVGSSSVPLCAMLYVMAVTQLK